MKTTDNNTNSSTIPLLGFDFGTTNMKAVLTDNSGTVLAVHREKIDYDTDSTGRCEFPAADFIRSLQTCIRGVCTTGGVDPSRIGGVSYASQANTFLILDREGTPVSPIVSWQDSRVVEPANSLVDLWDRPDFLSTTGLGIFSTGLSVVKIASLRTPDMDNDDLWVMSVSDYAMYLFTGDRIGDSSTASMIGLYNLQTESWWPDAIEAAGVNEQMLSVPVRPGRIAGTVDAKGAGLFGYSAGMPVVAGGLDHYVAAIGAGTSTLASACESTGTVVACIFTGPDIAPAPGACLGPGLDGSYLLTFDSFGGTLLEQYRAQHHPDISFAELDRLADACPPGACGLIANICEGGALEFSEEYGTAETQALAGAARIGAETRAILEGTAFKLRRLVNTAVQSGLDAIVSTGGGAKSVVWSRIKASVLGTKFITIDAEEPAAYGAAFLAGRATGVVKDGKAGLPESWISVRRIVEPDPSEAAAYSRIANRYEAV